MYIQIKQFLTYVKTQFGKVVKVLRSDNGTEFVNSIYSNLFSTNGIIHQTTCAYTPQQNGVAERKHRHILEVTRAVRFQASIAIHLWGYCVLVVVHIINRLPSLAIDYQVPYERLYGKKASYDHLRVLGCLCYAKVLNENDKLMPRARTTVFIGTLTQRNDMLSMTYLENLWLCVEIFHLGKIYSYLK